MAVALAAVKVAVMVAEVMVAAATVATVGTADGQVGCDSQERAVEEGMVVVYGYTGSRCVD